MIPSALLGSHAGLLTLIALASCTIAAADDTTAPVDLVIHVFAESGEPQAEAEVHCVRWDYDGLPRTQPLTEEERATTDSPEPACFLS